MGRSGFRQHLREAASTTPISSDKKSLEAQNGFSTSQDFFSAKKKQVTEAVAARLLPFGASPGHGLWSDVGRLHLAVWGGGRQHRETGRTV